MSGRETSGRNVSDRTRDRDGRRRSGRGSDAGERASGDGSREAPSGRGAELASLHPDWRAAWGGTIVGRDLRAEMEGNPRLHQRMLTAIAERHDLSVTRAPRLDRTGSAVAGALREDAEGFVRLCGLARIGHRLALATNPDDYAALARTFGRPALVAATRIAAALPPDEGEHGYDSEQLGPAVDRMGAAVLREWGETLPRASAEWIAMHMPLDDDEAGGPVGTERARRIVEGAAERWSSVRESGGRGSGDGSLPARRRRAA